MALRLAQRKETSLRVRSESSDDVVTGPEELDGGRDGRVAEPDPDDLGRVAAENADRMKVLVLRDEYKTTAFGSLPEGVVRAAAELEIVDVG